MLGRSQAYVFKVLKANGLKLRRYRERQKQSGSVTSESVTHTVTPEGIDALPLSLKAQIEVETRAPKILHMPDNLRERQEAMVRRFRGW